MGIGAMIMGIGMYISGACPGMVAVQLGTGVGNAHITIIGGLVGAFLYGVWDPHIMPLLERSQAINGNVAGFFDLKWKNVTMTFIVVCAAVAGGLEYMIPTGRWIGAWHAKATWPPSICGMLIGLLQLPLVLLGKKLGCSRSYMTLVSQPMWCSTKWQESLKYLEGKRCGLKNWWQVVFVCCSSLGARQSALFAGSIGTNRGVSRECAFFGGLMLLFGARMAGGCPSGLGISNMAALSIYAFIAVAAMFAGGIFAALIHKYFLY